MNLCAADICAADALVALHLAFPFLPAKGHQLLRHFGSARAVLMASALEIESCIQDKGRTAAALEKILDEDQVQKTRQSAEEMEVEIVPYASSSYPPGLQALPDPPLALYCKGILSSFTTPGVTIVGTRQCTLYGKTMARQFASICGEQGIPVISGLARGIDTAAHEGALDHGHTVAVIGSGLAHIYPKENVSLAKKICEKGVLCSEYPLFTPPDRFQFPRRNRLIAALADAALLIEAPLQSGAMGTLEWVASLGKPCFALPGRVDCETFRGNHRLIKEGKAKLVENAAEMISLLRPGTFRQAKRMDPVADLTPTEQQLLLQFPQNEVSFDELALSTRLPIATLNALLMGLNIKNIIREHPGKLFRKVT